MGLEYLKITPEIMLKISAYDQEQQGRLVMAMIAYALHGEEPDFDGMEKFIWPVLKLDIDNCTNHVEKQKANGSRGGRPPKQETQDKPSESQQNPAKPSETQDKPSESLNTNTNTNMNTNTKKEDVDVVDARARANAATPACVEGIDGSDLSDAIALNAEVDVLLKKYRLAEYNRDALMDEIGKHGLDKVREVMKKAAASDNRGGLSIAYIRACLANDGKPKPVRASPAGNGSKDRMMRYSSEERKATYSAAVVDFDEVDG